MQDYATSSLRALFLAAALHRFTKSMSRLFVRGADGSLTPRPLMSAAEYEELRKKKRARREVKGYDPHQSERECARRRRQFGLGGGQ